MNWHLKSAGVWHGRRGPASERGARRRNSAGVGVSSWTWGKLRVFNAQLTGVRWGLPWGIACILYSHIFSELARKHNHRKTSRDNIFVVVLTLIRANRRKPRAKKTKFTQLHTDYYQHCMGEVGCSRMLFFHWSPLSLSALGLSSAWFAHCESQHKLLKLISIWTTASQDPDSEVSAKGMGQQAQHKSQW